MPNYIKSLGLLVFLALSGMQNLYADNSQYDKMWKEYQTLENKGSYKDALALAQKIFNNSVKDKNTEQKFKALIHIYKNKSVVEENSEDLIVDDLKTQIEEATSADEKVLLQTLLARAYQSYYTGNQYKIIDRTYSQELADDFTLWDARQFKNQIDALYQDALSQGEALKNYPLDRYTNILVLDKKNPYQVNFGSLQDIIYYEAVRYYNSEQIRLTDAAGQFEINLPEYFSEAPKFTELKLKAKDENAYLFRALKYIQQWQALHDNDENSELSAFIDDYRLSFVYDRYVGEKKAELYETALEKAAAYYSTKNSKSLFEARKILLWNNQSDEFGKTPVQLVSEAEKLIKQYPDTYGAELMQNLLTSLRRQELSVNLEEAVPSKAPFKTQVSYKNISEASFKIIEWSDAFNKDLPYKIDEVWSAIGKQKTVRTGTFKLPSSQDLKSHSIEFTMKELPFGQYALVVFTKDLEKNIQSGKFSIAPFYVSNLTVSLRETENDIVITVKDRTSGKPLNDIKTSVGKRQGLGRADLNVLSGFTNEKGEIFLSKKTLGQSATYFVEVKNGSNVYQTSDQYFYNYKYKESTPEWRKSIQIFTDRSIYRPGQEVYFKGIAIESKTDTVRPLNNLSVQVRFLDANYQNIGTQTYTTNEFGSFSGFFKIPEGGLNGSFRIETDFGSASIAVEEYKRPTFEVKTLPVEGDFQLGDTITVKGTAIAYSGAKITQAEVRYLIKRSGYFPIWRYFYRGIWPPYNAQPTIMATGTVMTDEEGNYEINFIAEADKNKLNSYQYDISVDVQDMTGEVRSTQTLVRVGKNGVQPQMSVDAAWTPNTASTLKVSSNNLQNQPVQSSFKISIQKLTVPSQPKKKRYWSVPDQFSMTEAEYNKLFPYDNYQGEMPISEWKAGANIWTQTIQVSGDSILDILPKNLSAGMYKITAVILDRGDTIRLENTFEVKEKMTPSVKPDFIKVAANQSSYNPGEILEISFASDLQEAYVHVFFTHKNNILKDTVIHLKGAAQNLTLPIEESMRGNIILHYEVSAQNRDFSGSQTISIPYEMPGELTYQWKTFRNKLLPGAKETWSLQIFDKNKTLADAELLATMYDASLDQFLPHGYSFRLFYPVTYSFSGVVKTNISFKTSLVRNYTGSGFYQSYSYPGLYYPQLNYFGFNIVPYRYGGNMIYMRSAAGGMALQKIMAADAMPAPAAKESLEESANYAMEESVTDGDRVMGEVMVEEDAFSAQNIALRKNFAETAFFYPQLKKDKDGNYSFEFTMPDALTTWKFLAVAHTKGLEHTIIQEEVVSQKDLMIQMNKPRFVRMGDELYLSARVSNLTENAMEATVNITFRDAQTNKDVTKEILQSGSEMKVNLAAGNNAHTEWKINIPSDYEGLIYEVTASAGNQTDGESDMIPVLENRMLLTESYPFFIRKKGKEEINLKEIIRDSKTAEAKSLTFEYSSQPIWQVLTALPYLNENKDASATSLFNRFYANTMAAYILKSVPESKKLLEAWKKEGSLKSALEKNQELKSVALEATPWLRDAQNETEQMQSLFRLLDDAQNEFGKELLLKKLQELQDESGGLSWYPGMPANRYMTQNIVLGLYRSQHLGMIKISSDKELNAWIDRALKYLEYEAQKSFERIKKNDNDYLNHDHLSYIEIQYLWLISHLNGKKLNDAEKYFYQQAQKYALDKNNYAKAALALTLNRMGDKKMAKDILYSLKQSAVESDQLGMYWKGGTSYFWYQAPIETHALAIQAFEEVNGDTKTADELKIWLMTQKKTSRWVQPNATADACYALLLTGGDWKSSKKQDKIKFDKTKIDKSTASAGTGYIKTTWTAGEIKDAPDKISIKKKTKGPSWGSVYYQYWEDIDKVQASIKDLQVRRTLYRVVNTAKGEELQIINENTPLTVGEKVRVKLELKFDRDVEFFHLQDTRGAGFEPVSVLSRYKYQGGLGYYEVTGDAATHWYMDRVNKGTYVFEYTVFVNMAGVYSSGVTTGECLYAPEFRFQSAGQRVSVGK